MSTSILTPTLRLVCTGFAVMLLFVASYWQADFVASAVSSGDGLNPRTERDSSELPNYDIRIDKLSFEKRVEFRGRSGKAAPEIADLRDRFVEGENELRRRVPSLKIEYNDDLRIPEVIGPDVKHGRASLTSPSNMRRAEILRSFAKQNESLIGVPAADVDSLQTTAEYTNPDGNLSFAHLEQAINGIPVFRGEIKAGFNKDGEMVRVINNLAPGLNEAQLSADFGDPVRAVEAAARHINIAPESLPLQRNESASSRSKEVFGSGDWAPTAEKMYFPTEPGVAVPSWRVLIWQPVNAYYVIVDAETGTMLWRKNITEDQTQAATYNVWSNPTAMINVADSPFPITPGPSSLSGIQGAAIPRVSVTRVGNEAPYTFNNNGWITDGVTTTDGNANEAGLDRENPSGIDPNGKPVAADRVFDFPINPGIPTNPAQNTGDSPLPAGVAPTPCAAAGTSSAMIDFQRAAVTQLFYINNWYHDEMYMLGFTEQARNFQHSNFGRGGAENDRVSAEAQDCSGTNNANFSTPADGGRGRMQMYLWTGPTPDFDGDLDADVIIHEHTHGLSNRLHGNGSGLSLNMSRGMGEGWSDFYGHAMLSEPTDPIDGVYTTGAYDTYRLGGVGFNNAYYGIRRFPKSVISSTGGPNNRPHNPLTFADVDGSRINTTDGAFPASGGGSADQVHNAGEIWSSALWEVRARFVTRLGWAVGNRKVLQLVTDGMKLAPIGPTFLTERDAILAAAQVGGTADDVADIWAGFAARGMGFSASIENAGTGSGNARVTEAFDLPNLLQTPSFTFTDANGNGFPEPGEALTLTVPLTNNTGSSATGVTLQVAGGGSADYGSIAHGASVTRNVSYTVPIVGCGNAVTLTFNVNSSLGARSFSRTLIVGQPQVTYTQNFDSVTAPAFPAGWTAVSVSSGPSFVTATANSESAPNSAYALEPATVGGGTHLTSPSLPVTAQAALLTFSHRYDTEAGWDGGVLEISIAGGAFQDILSAGGAFVQNGYDGALGGNGVNNPLAGRNSWNGNSNGYRTSIVRLPASAAGQNVQFRFAFGSDNNTVGTGPNPGWNIDNISFAGTAICVDNFGNTRADFDGDGKTDLSLFRPSDGVWYLNRSTAGFTALGFGVETDVVVPGDYDGDGKTDAAVWRPSTGTWHILRSSDNGYNAATFGAPGDIPVQGDYDGDSRSDFAVFRPSDGTWYIAKTTGGISILPFGTLGDRPVQADYDGDGKTDLAIYRNGEWWISKSSGGISVYGVGIGTDKPVPADYDGDGKSDVAVYRPSNGVWYILRSSNGGFDFIPFGAPADVPAPGDYDGDGEYDQAVFRDGQWHLNRSSQGYLVAAFGTASDRPAPAAYNP